MTRRELSREVLLAQCELDRHELSAEIGAIRDHVRSGVRRAGSVLPWLLIGAPVAGVLLSRFVRVRRLAGLLVLGRIATQLRPWLPLLIRVLLANKSKPPL